MKKIFSILMLMLAFNTAYAEFKDNKYTIEVANQNGSLHANVPSGVLTSGVLTFVYQAGTKTLATLYADASHTSLSNPISRATFATNGIIKFYTTEGSVDLVVAHSDGTVAKFEGLTPQAHRVAIDQSNADKVLVIPFTADALERDSGIDIPKNALITDVMLEVVTGQVSKTLSVGLATSETNGDDDGLLAGVDISATGFKRGVAVTVGGSETYVSSYLYGALMGPGIVGTNANGDFGLGIVPGHVVTGSNAKRISYKGSSGTSGVTGYIYVFYKLLR